MDFFYKIRHKETGLYYKPGQTGFRKASSLTKLGKTYDSLGKVKSAVKGLTHYNDAEGNSFSNIDFDEHFEVYGFQVTTTGPIDIS